MLLNLTIENCKSWKNKTVFSMRASKEKQHRDRLTQLKTPQANILPASLLLGANGSGKTNLLQALCLAKELVSDGDINTARMEWFPYHLAQGRTGKPSVAKPVLFCFEILAEETLYEYSFTLDSSRIIAEKLTEIKSSTNKVLFERKNQNVKVHPSLPDQKSLALIAECTREDRLFLYNTINLNRSDFEPVWKWFLYTLNVSAENEPSNMTGQMPSNREIASFMQAMGLEVTKITTDPTHKENLVFISHSYEIDAIFDKLYMGQVTIKQMPGNNLFLFCHENEAIYRISPHIKMNDGTENVWQFGLLPEGTRNMVAYLPLLAPLISQKSDKVVCIDSTHTDWHPLLTRELLKHYLASRSKDSRSQLIVTGHEAELLDHDVLRRDEMWLVEKDSLGVSSLNRVSDQEGLRADQSVAKKYLAGELGGLPVFQ